VAPVLEYLCSIPRTLLVASWHRGCSLMSTFDIAIDLGLSVVLIVGIYDA
jgi:hypothetical protein